MTIPNPDGFTRNKKLIIMRLKLINRTINSLSKSPDDKVQEVSNFTEFILKKYEDEILQKGIHNGSL